MQSAPLRKPAAKPPEQAPAGEQPPASQTPAPAPPILDAQPEPMIALDLSKVPLPPVSPQPAPTHRAEYADRTISVPDNSMFVLDTSALDDERVHEQVIGGAIRKFRFQPRRPTPLPPEVAVKFLKHDGFILTDADGTPQDWSATPRQPHELGAGEVMALSPDECVANFDELNRGALCKRALQMGANEMALDAEKADLIAYIKRKTLDARKLKLTAKHGESDDIGVDEFTPEASMLDEPTGSYAF